VAVADQLAKQLGRAVEVPALVVDAAQSRVEESADVVRSPQERVAETVAQSAL